MKREQQTAPRKLPCSDSRTFFKPKKTFSSREFLTVIMRVGGAEDIVVYKYVKRLLKLRLTDWFSAQPSIA